MNGGNAHNNIYNKYFSPLALYYTTNNNYDPIDMRV